MRCGDKIGNTYEGVCIAAILLAVCGVWVFRYRFWFNFKAPANSLLPISPQTPSNFRSLELYLFSFHQVCWPTDSIYSTRIYIQTPIHMLNCCPLHMLMWSCKLVHASQFQLWKFENLQCQTLGKFLFSKLPRPRFELHAVEQMQMTASLYACIHMRMLRGVYRVIRKLFR